MDCVSEFGFMRLLCELSRPEGLELGLRGKSMARCLCSMTVAVERRLTASWKLR